MKIEHIYENSLAKRLGLRKEDEIAEINGHPIRDSLDFRFWANEDVTILKVRQDGQLFEYDIDGGLGDFGVEFAPMKFRSCGNKCTFCFVDQNPKGLRKSLYFKDEDYRLSFLYGNYVTLTNTSRSDLNRIVEQRLSPLYISVHATDPETRKRMFGLRRDDRLMQKIEFLAKHKIEMNAQVVLCPDINDGVILENTLITLAKYYPKINTVAIVPVGLTKHRQNLPYIRRVNKQYASTFVEWIEDKAVQFKIQLGSHFVYLADEFYLLAQKPLPEADRYEGFDQIENGVGMARQMMDAFAEKKWLFPKKMPRPMNLNLVTGKMAEPIISATIASALSSIGNFSVRIISAPNDFFGNRITVSGLLVGQDIYNSLKKSTPGDAVWLPGNCINHDGLFLDDWTPEQLEQKLNISVQFVDNSVSSALSKLSGEA